MGNTIIPKLFSDYRKLLWTNPNPTSAFSAQTVSLNLTDYDEVEIEARNSTSNSDSVTQNFSFSSGGGILTIFQLNDTWYMRQLTLTNSGITFASGRYCYMTNGGNGVLDAVCVPTKIYGIKYERVTPGVIDAEIESLAAGATLHRIGRMRILVLSDFVYGTAMSALASGDRPSSTATGMGLRYSNSAYFCFAFIAVNTNGTVTISNVGTYNTSAGISVPGSGEKFNATVVWYVSD